MNRLPEFSMADYRQLLGAFRNRDCRFEVLGDLPHLTAARNFICLRHDVDCHRAVWNQHEGARLHDRRVEAPKHSESHADHR